MTLPQNMTGTHYYNISPYAKYALHSFSNYKTQPATDGFIARSKPINEKKSITKNMKVDENTNTHYFKSYIR